MRQRCEGKPEGDGVSALTTEERTRWAKVYLFTFFHLWNYNPRSKYINPCVFCGILLQKLLSVCFKHLIYSLKRKSHITLSVLKHLSFLFPFLFTSSKGPRVSNKYWSTERDHPGAHPEQPVHHMPGWNQAILQSRKLHQRMSSTDRGCALQAASATSDCVTLLFWAQITKESLKGDPTIRWGDKSYTLIVYSDGTFGSNCDVSFFLHLAKGV